MPKPVRKKKHFIRKKESKTYKLIPGFVESDEEEEKPAPEELSQRKEDQREHGIYFSDDYNYLRHMRSVTEAAQMVIDEPIDDDTRSQATSRMPLPFMFFSTDETEEEKIDPELLAAMDEAPVVPLETIEEGEGGSWGGLKDFLDDDFIAQAGGVVVKEKEEREVQEGDDSDREFDFDSEEDDETFSGSDFSDNVSDISDKVEETTVPHQGRGTAEDDMIEAQTAQILKNFEEGLGFQLSSMDCVDAEMPTAEDYEQLKHIIGQQSTRSKITSWSEVLDDKLEKAPVDTAKYLYEDEDEFEWKDAPPAKPQFDAVSILSLRSNTRNLPTDIIPPSKQKSKKATISECESESTIGQFQGLSLKQLEEEMRESRRADKASTFRPSDETLEEKRLRKKAVKDERKDRRQEKKANKMVFSLENEKMKKETANLSKSGKRVALA